jgi:type IV secretory pathway VirB10-like protein
MLPNRFAFAALAVGCIGAAAAGGYIASRQNAVPAAAQAQAPAPAAQSAAPTAPVQETEAVVGDSAPRASIPASKSAPPRRAETTARTGAAQPREARAAAPPSREQATPPLTSSWPSGSTSQPPPAPQPTPPVETPQVHADDKTPEPARAPEPPQNSTEELVVSSQTVIGLQTETRLSSETARVEDRVDARVTRDVRVGDRVAIPAGSRAIGSVMQVDRGGKFRERARLGIRFHTLVLADGTRVPISTETIFRDGEAPGNSSAAKVGGAAVGGAIIGAILGGAKGAAIGATAGAGGGTAAVMAGDRQAATLPAGTAMTVRILQPVTIEREKN